MALESKRIEEGANHPQPTQVAAQAPSVQRRVADAPVRIQRLDRIPDSMGPTIGAPKPKQGNGATLANPPKTPEAAAKRLADAQAHGQRLHLLLAEQTAEYAKLTAATKWFESKPHAAQIECSRDQLASIRSDAQCNDAQIDALTRLYEQLSIRAAASVKYVKRTQRALGLADKLAEGAPGVLATVFGADLAALPAQQRLAISGAEARFYETLARYNASEGPTQLSAGRTMDAAFTQLEKALAAAALINPLT